MNTNTEHTILVVDDAPEDLNLLAQQLLENEYQVLVAKSGERALERVRLRTPDLILLDLRMAGIDGIETCRQLKADPVLETVPVIFLTSSTDSLDKAQGFAVGGVDYINKPLDMQEVLLRVRTHLSISQLRKELEASNVNLEARVAERTGELEAEIARRGQSESEKNALLETVRAQGEHLQQLTNKMIEFQMQRRQSLAQELGGQVSQQLGLSIERLGNIQQAASAKKTQLELGAVTDQLRKIQQFVEQVEASLNNDTDNVALTNNPLLKLSAREREVLLLMVNGHATDKVANMLHVSAATVRTYRYRIVQKLGVEDRAGLMAFAKKHQLIE